MSQKITDLHVKYEHHYKRLKEKVYGKQEKLSSWNIGSNNIKICQHSVHVIVLGIVENHARITGNCHGSNEG